MYTVGNAVNDFKITDPVSQLSKKILENEFLKMLDYAAYIYTNAIASESKLKPKTSSIEEQFFHACMRKKFLLVVSLIGAARGVGFAIEVINFRPFVLQGYA